MVVHHSFDMSPREFHDRKAWPIPGESDGNWKGEYASQSPTNAFYVTREGAGADGKPGYMVLPAGGSDQFYAEVTPQWERPQQTYDLRNTRVTMYLKALSPITVNPGYHPYLFIDDWDDVTKSFCGWYLSAALSVGKDWTLNTIDLGNDEKLWTRYSNNRPLDRVLSRVGFLGVMYLKGAEFKGVNAHGALGIDELRFNLPMG